MISSDNIPKVIHYCWFGGKPLPSLAHKCIASWKKYFPDYEIKEWNESNFDVSMIAYTKQAYDAKKYAFVSDYARFWILYNHGGIYFDTDVEVIKSFDDILEQGAFMGLETTEDGKYAPAPGLGIACAAGHDTYEELLESYKQEQFLLQNGEQDLSTIVSRTRDILKKYGFVEKNETQKVHEILIYPADYFCPKDFATGKLTITENTRSIHWYDASWQPKSSKIFYSFTRFLPLWLRKTLKRTLREIKK